MYRRSQKEKHRAQMVERYGRTNMPATYTMSGLQKRMVYDSMKARLEGRRNPDDDDDDVQP